MQNRDQPPGILERLEGAGQRILSPIFGESSIIDNPLQPIRDGLNTIFNSVAPELPTLRMHTWLEEAYNRVTSFFSPVANTRINSPMYSDRRPTHPGVDMANAEGTPIRAVADGMISLVRHPRFGNESNSLGRGVVQDHGDGNWVSVYAHASEVGVNPGQIVRAGEHIMDMGHTGSVRSSNGGNGDHLHYENMVRGEDGLLYRIDPQFVFNQTYDMTNVEVRESLINRTMQTYGKERDDLRPTRGLEARIENALEQTGTYNPTPSIIASARSGVGAGVETAITRLPGLGLGSE